MPMARRMLPAHVEVVELETDDAWLRDIGPSFVEESDGDGRRTRLAGWDWTFNAWGGADGGCYSSWTRDDAAASSLLRRMDPQVWVVHSDFSLFIGGDGSRGARALFLPPVEVPLFVSRPRLFVSCPSLRIAAVCCLCRLQLSGRGCVCRRRTKRTHRVRWMGRDRRECGGIEAKSCWRVAHWPQTGRCAHLFLTPNSPLSLVHHGVCSRVGWGCSSRTDRGEQGTLLTTRSCVLNVNRNAAWTQSTVRAACDDTRDVTRRGSHEP